MNTVTVLGDGAWGTAMATVLAARGNRVVLWCYDPAIAHSIVNTRTNDRYLPGIKLDPLIEATTDLEYACSQSALIFEAVPVAFLREVLVCVRSVLHEQHRWVILSKGLEQDTLMLPTQVIDDVLGVQVAKAVISGPSFSRDVALRRPTGVVMAAEQKNISESLCKLVTTDYFKAYQSTDMIGVQVGGALKNVIALGIGILDGAGHTDNARALVLTHGLHDMVRCAQALGGKAETVYGLAGLGDVILTAMGSVSRNVQMGRRIGKGETLDAIAHERAGVLPEGVNTVISAYQLCKRHGLHMPVLEGIYQLAVGTTTVNRFLALLLEQDAAYVK